MVSIGLPNPFRSSVRGNQFLDTKEGWRQETHSSGSKSLGSLSPLSPISQDGNDNDFPIGGYQQRNFLGRPVYPVEYVYHGRKKVTPRKSHASCVIRAKRGPTFQWLVHGGETENKQFRSDLELYDGSRQAFTTIKPIQGRDKPPVSRSEHTMVYRKGFILIYGGKAEDGRLLNDLYVFHLGQKTWHRLDSEQSPVEPPNCAGHTLTYSPNHDKMYLFGGYSIKGEAVGSMFCYDFKTLRWEEMKCKYMCPPRFYHSCDVYDNKLIVISGKDNNEYRDDVWQYYIDKNKWLQISTFGINPFPVYGHSSCIYSHNLYILGGKFPRRDTLYRLNLITRFWQRIETKGAVYNDVAFHSLLPIDGGGLIAPRLVLFGGELDNRKIGGNVYDIVIMDRERKLRMKLMKTSHFRDIKITFSSKRELTSKMSYRFAVRASPVKTPSSPGREKQDSRICSIM